jgi:tetratricopeptide (TPR) repeat protein
MRRPLFLAGKVMMEDGTPPPDSVLIERVCNGQPRPEGYTDRKGRFSFELGRNTHLVADASVGSMNDPAYESSSTMGPSSTSRGGASAFGGPNSGISERDLMGCELRASLAGFRSDVVNLTGRRLLDNPDVGTIILHRLAGVEGFTVSATSINAPKDAKKAYEKGVQALQKQKWEDGQKQLQKAVAIYPQYAAAWFDLGRVYEQQNNLEEARKAYGQAVAADEKFVKPYLQLANLAAREQKWEETAANSERVMKLNPFDFPGAYFLHAVAAYNLKKLDVAEKSCRDGLKADPQHRFPKMDHVLGVILAQKQDFAGAARHMKNYLQLAPNASDAEVVKSQLAQIEQWASQAQPKPQQ